MIYFVFAANMKIEKTAGFSYSEMNHARAVVPKFTVSFLIFFIETFFGLKASKFSLT